MCNWKGIFVCFLGKKLNEWILIEYLLDYLKCFADIFGLS